MYASTPFSRTALTLFVCMLALMSAPGVIAASVPDEALVIFDTSGSMAEGSLGWTPIDVAKERAQRMWREGAPIVVTVLAVDESGRDLGTYDLSSTDGFQGYLSAVRGIEARPQDTNLDEVKVRIEHVAYRRGLPSGTPVYVFSDNISDPTPGHPHVDLAQHAVRVTDLGGCQLFELQIGKGLEGAAEIEERPGRPAGLRADVSTDTVALTWDGAKPQPDRYQVYRSTDSDDWQRIYSGPHTTFSDDAVDPETSYRYYVEAISADGLTSEPSRVLSVRMPALPMPAMPGPVVPTWAIFIAVAVAALLIGVAVMSGLLPRDRVVVESAGSKRVPLGRLPVTVGGSEGIRFAPRLGVSPARRLTALAPVAVNGRRLSGGSKATVHDGDLIETAASTYRYSVD